MFAAFSLTLALACASPACCSKPAPSWQDDPVCQVVFFATLEGLYRDGVPDEVVDAIVPRQPKCGQNPVKTSFVFQCPLCHPVYEAFALYQKRPAFVAGGHRSTFGAGLDADLVRDLKNPEPKPRLSALAKLVKRWVEHRLAGMRLSDVEKKEWEAKLWARSAEGRNRLGKLLTADDSYKGWSIYWGCAACNGTTAASREVQGAAK